jgi:hypothetical protein
VKKTLDSALRKAASSHRGRRAVLVTTTVALGLAISMGAAALATDTRSTVSPAHATDTQSTSTDTHTTTTDKTTTGTTTTGTTTTATTTTTVTQGVAGAVGGGGKGGGPGAAPGGGGEAAGPSAAEAAAPQGQLAVTGVPYAPALILIALGMLAAGIVLRRKLEDAA